MPRLAHFIIFMGIALLPAHGQTKQPKQYMRITALQYREKNTEAPYRVEGKTSPTVLYYRLSCKKEASNLHVGRTYEIEESVDDNGLKTLWMLLPDAEIEKPIPGAIFLVICTVESATVREGK
jgi:hypothetical protein